MSTVGLGDLTLSSSDFSVVLLQFTLFFPGLALFAEFVALGNEYSRMVQLQAQQTSDQISENTKSMIKRLASQEGSVKHNAVAPAPTSVEDNYRPEPEATWQVASITTPRD